MFIRSYKQTNIKLEGDIKCRLANFGLGMRLQLDQLLRFAASDRRDADKSKRSVLPDSPVLVA
jgi:hypothetical protein